MNSSCAARGQSIHIVYVSTKAQSIVHTSYFLCLQVCEQRSARRLCILTRWYTSSYASLPYPSSSTTKTDHGLHLLHTTPPTRPIVTFRRRATSYILWIKKRRISSAISRDSHPPRLTTPPPPPNQCVTSSPRVVTPVT